MAFQAMAGRPATAGLTWKPDSCSMTATVAHRLPRVAGRPSSEKDVWMSVAQPPASFTLGGMALRATVRASSGASPALSGEMVWQPASSRAVTSSTPEEIEPFMVLG